MLHSLTAQSIEDFVYFGEHGSFGGIEFPGSKHDVIDLLGASVRSLQPIATLNVHYYVT